MAHVYDLVIVASDTKELIAELYLGIYMDYFHNDSMLLTQT
jgi:hypothetical protein